MNDKRRLRDEIEKAAENARRSVNAALDQLGMTRERFKHRRKAKPKSTNEKPPYWVEKD